MDERVKVATTLHSKLTSKRLRKTRADCWGKPDAGFTQPFRLKFAPWRTRSVVMPSIERLSIPLSTREIRHGFRPS